MGKFPVGVQTKYVHGSRGGEVNINNFYHTRYGNEYGTEGYRPRKGFAVGTGYHNIRPQIFYKQSLDELDNPYMGRLLSHNYESIMKKHYKASCGSVGTDHFPDNVYRNGVTTGFTEQKPLIGIPTVAEVHKVNFDTRKYGAISRPGLQPKYRIQLAKTQRKDPVENENHYHGSAYMKTEVKSQYRGARPQVNTDGKDIGKKEETGWLVNKNIEPVTYIENNAFEPRCDGVNTRPTGISLTTEDFVGYKDQVGREVFPQIIDGSTRYTGFIRDPSMRFPSTYREGYTSLKECGKDRADHIRKIDPAEYTNIKYGQAKISTVQTQHKGKQREPRNMPQILNTEDVGNKELSGDCWNNVRYEPTKNYDQLRYLTHYNSKHYDMNPHRINRMGWTMGGVQVPKRDGFTHNTNTHVYGKNVDENRKLRSLKPVVAKSIKCEDRFFGEQIHRHKMAPHAHDHYYKVEPFSTATLETAVALS